MQAASFRVRPTRQAWSSLRRPSSPASAAWSSSATSPRRAAASILSEPMIRLPGAASSPSRSSAAWRSAASIRSPRSSGTESSPVLNARASAPFSLPLACAASSAARSTPIQAPRPGRPGAHVGRDLAVRAEREADQLVACRGAPGEDAVALGRVLRRRPARSAPGRWRRRLASALRSGVRLTRQRLIGRFPQPRPPRPGVLVLEPVGAGGHDDLVALLLGEAIFGEHAALVLGPDVLGAAARLEPLLRAISSSVARSARSSSVLMPALPSVTSIAR